MGLQFVGTGLEWGQTFQV